MKTGTSLAVQRLRLCASTAGGTDLIPGWGTKIPHAVVWPKKKKKGKKTVLMGWDGRTAGRFALLFKLL